VVLLMQVRGGLTFTAWFSIPNFNGGKKKVPTPIRGGGVKRLTGATSLLPAELRAWLISDEKHSLSGSEDGRGNDLSTPKREESNSNSDQDASLKTKGGPRALTEKNSAWTLLNEGVVYAKTTVQSPSTGLNHLFGGRRGGRSPIRKGKPSTRRRGFVCNRRVEHDQVPSCAKLETTEIKTCAG